MMEKIFEEKLDFFEKEIRDIYDFRLITEVTVDLVRRWHGEMVGDDGDLQFRVLDFWIIFWIPIAGWKFNRVQDFFGGPQNGVSPDVCTNNNILIANLKFSITISGDSDMIVIHTKSVVIHVNRILIASVFLGICSSGTVNTNLPAPLSKYVSSRTGGRKLRIRWRRCGSAVAITVQLITPRIRIDASVTTPRIQIGDIVIRDSVPCITVCKRIDSFHICDIMIPLNISLPQQRPNVCSSNRNFWGRSRGPFLLLTCGGCRLFLLSPGHGFLARGRQFPTCGD
jgi:hypothetical protein